jgi:hypothetical protein
MLNRFAENWKDAVCSSRQLIGRMTHDGRRLADNSATRRPWFIQDPSPIRRFRCVGGVALNASEFATTRLDDDEVERLVASRTSWRRWVLRHDAHLEQARALPDSLSPINAANGR